MNQQKITSRLMGVSILFILGSLASAFSFYDMFPINLRSEEIQNQITVLNPQSYPSLYGNWTVYFNTTGTADLTITAVNGTEFNKDLEFLGVRCGSTTLSYGWVNGSVFISNYSCNETGYEISKVLTTGKHILEFKLGGDIRYALNYAE